MNILLTGSGGFVGKNLKTFLIKQHNLFCPRSFELDLTDKNAVRKYFEKNEIEFVIHCGSTGGARGIEDNPLTVQNNLAMVNNLLEAKEKNVRMILFGSGAMYGKDRNLHKVSETEIGNYIPKDLYGQSKHAIAKIVEKRDDILMLNIFACYGYGEKESRFPSYAITQVLKKEDIVINQNCIFDYLWIEDLQKIVSYFVANKPTDKIINVTPTKSFSLTEIARIAKNISKNDIEIIVKNVKMNNEYTGNNELLLKNLPDFEFTSMAEGMKMLYDYLEGFDKILEL